MREGLKTCETKNFDIVKVCGEGWRRMGQVKQIVMEERNILHTAKRRAANWIDYIWRGNSL
jgi:hypothetical protein